MLLHGATEDEGAHGTGHGGMGHGDGGGGGATTLADGAGVLQAGFVLLIFDFFSFAHVFVHSEELSYLSLYFCFRLWRP